MAGFQQITSLLAVFASLLAILSLLLATQAAEFGGGAVLHLSTSDFEEKVLISPRVPCRKGVKSGKLSNCIAEGVGGGGFVCRVSCNRESLVGPVCGEEMLMGLLHWGRCRCS